MPASETLVRATQDATFTAAGTAADTITIGGKVYTLQSSLTDVDGNVLIGGSAEATIDNLVAAINLGAGAGTAYAASMTRNEKVMASKFSASVLRVHAAVPGSIGNHVPVAEVSTALSWGAATLASGSGSIQKYLEQLLDQSQINADVMRFLQVLTFRSE